MNKHETVKGTCRKFIDPFKIVVASNNFEGDFEAVQVIARQLEASGGTGEQLGSVRNDRLALSQIAQGHDAAVGTVAILQNACEVLLSIDVIVHEARIKMQISQDGHRVLVIGWTHHVHSQGRGPQKRCTRSGLPKEEGLMQATE